MKFNIYPQEFPALSRYLLRFADSGRFRTIKPQNSLVWNREFFGWLDKYVK